jgi:AcrR family transcriptional regulator
MTETVQTSPRKDAARNRARLLQAADELITTEGLEVTLKDVARRAGVGVGTVYRHFPTKDDLLTALFTEQLDAEVERARERADDVDGWDALVRYLEDTMVVQAKNTGLRALLCPTGGYIPAVRECKTIIDPYVRQMVDRAHEQGTLRLDCDATDLAALQTALVAIMDANPDSSPDLYRRHLHLFLDGVRAR